MWVLGNKGAVGVSFMFNGTSFGFVNSHLTSGSEKKLRWRMGSTLSNLKQTEIGFIVCGRGAVSSGLDSVLSILFLQTQSKLHQYPAISESWR